MEQKKTRPSPEAAATDAATDHGTRGMGGSPGFAANNESDPAADAARAGNAARITTGGTSGEGKPASS